MDAAICQPTENQLQSSSVVDIQLCGSAGDDSFDLHQSNTSRRHVWLERMKFGPAPQLDPQLKPQLKPRLDLQLEPQMDPQLEPQMDPQMESQQDPQLDPQLEPQLEPQMDPQLKPQLKPQLDPQLEPQPNETVVFIKQLPDLIDMHHFWLVLTRSFSGLKASRWPGLTLTRTSWLEATAGRLFNVHQWVKESLLAWPMGPESIPLGWLGGLWSKDVDLRVIGRSCWFGYGDLSGPRGLREGGRGHAASENGGRFLPVEVAAGAVLDVSSRWWSNRARDLQLRQDERLASPVAQWERRRERHVFHLHRVRWQRVRPGAGWRTGNIWWRTQMVLVTTADRVPNGHQRGTHTALLYSLTLSRRVKPSASSLDKSKRR